MSRTLVTLRVVGDDLDPGEVTALLGAEPTRCARRGAEQPGRSDKTVVARSGSWRLAAEECIPGVLNAQIVAILAKPTDDLPVWRELSGRYRCDVFCGLFMRESNEGTELDAAVMAMLGERGLRLGLNIYEPASDREPR